jgi:DNA-binding MarR family transcriptional regulator
MAQDTQQRTRGAFAAADRMHSAAIHLLRRVRREDEASGVSAARLSALSVLTFRGPVTVGELAEAEQVTAPTISRIVDGLERAGLARREAASSDRRSVAVRATPKGKRLLQRARRRRIDRLAADLGQLSAAELAVIERAADLIERAMSTADRR